ncbi:M23 family metallopeptidase [Bacteroides caecigallinarum]|uniref:murein hydrolase activator EnvC family protein n=1 Tax=Bacteroides caecigallinarum TaxID=1411144 RepID=UPI00195E1147|nr:M23 family metallopeptidase [Bacteroides caecigallinarum]MBM6882897.1 M23 family metallopeptidase [Bacteroides caecigallinarum]MBM6888780.1 M23 family metallopeptidase [Bacteroides caecigallinarum]
MRKKGRKAFWHNIKFKYKLTIINENTLEEVVGIHVSKLNGLSVLIFACTVIFIIAASIIAFTPLRNYLPGYMNSEVREMVVSNALRADSLKLALDRQNRYIMNIQDIFSGKIKTDTIQSIDSLTNLRAEQLMERTKEEEEFRQQYEEKERYNLRAIDIGNAVSGLVFFKPVEGVMEMNFDAEKKHYGIDVMTGPNANVLAVLDGTVIMATYTVSDGYVIQVQHSQNFISIYKHCGSLMKQPGERVKGGDVIALVGKSEEKQNEHYVHFELWHRGTPINPEKYVVF